MKIEDKINQFFIIYALKSHFLFRFIEHTMPMLFINLSESFTDKVKKLGYSALTMKIQDYIPNPRIKTYYMLEMQKQIVREINNGSWRSMDDYDNIINMTNIYKIMKSTTIENGINRALSTGDFSIKQSNSSKVGIAQVLSRLSYTSSLSHLRRVNTPIEKSGELIAPRKLHSKVGNNQ
jgi:DNA-directed RNA polymerase beta subunit